VGVFGETWVRRVQGLTSRRLPVSKEAEGSVRGKGPEGKPYERYRHEIGPEGRGRSKPARGCETLKSEDVGRGNPELTGLLRLNALKGTKPHESCYRFADGGQVRLDSEGESKFAGAGAFEADSTADALMTDGKTSRPSCNGEEGLLNP